MKFALAIASATAVTLKLKYSTAGTCVYTAANNQHGTTDYCTSQTVENRCLSNAYGGVDYGCSWTAAANPAESWSNATGAGAC